VSPTLRRRSSFQRVARRERGFRHVAAFVGQAIADGAAFTPPWAE
jgi:hypothetical protein